MQVLRIHFPDIAEPCPLPVFANGTSDRARGWVGEISIAPLKLGPFRLKERKKIWDNLARIFGYYLFEVEPVGFRPEEGEPETLEFYVQCSHFRFKGTDRTWTGARALINYVASL